MKKSKWLNLLILSLNIVLLTSCSDFLEQSDPSNVTVGNYFTQPSHARSVVNAVYEDLRPVYNGGGFGGAAWLMLEFRTGLANTTVLGSAGQANSTVRSLRMSSENRYLATYWRSYYRGIANANLAIEKIPDIQIQETEQKKILGEARFLRAYYYFNLVRLFGDIPIILEPIDLVSKKLTPVRSPISEVYDVIVEDLKWAEENSGLSFTDESGRVSLGAVKSLLSSVYLTMAGYPLQAGPEYYTLAKEKSAEVINSGQYNLFDSYADLHSKESENKGEYIFMVQYDEDISNRNGFQELFLPNGKGISLYASETGMLYPTSGFYGSYDSNDKRTQEKQFYYHEFTLESNRDRTIDLGSWYIYKWFDRPAHVETSSSGLSWPLIRFPEVLFIFAEATNEISGPTEEAYQAINIIRNRAQLPGFSNISQEKFRQAIWEEKWHEMSFENKIWFDMVRVRKAYNTETKNFDDFVGHQFSYGPTLTEKQLVFPIPNAEIQNNENLTQNPGY